MGSSHGTTGVWLHVVGYCVEWVHHMALQAYSYCVWLHIVGYCVEWVHHMALQACGFILLVIVLNGFHHMALHTACGFMLLVIVLNGFITCHYRRVASCCWLLC